MGKTENKDTIRGLKDEEVEKISGGADEGKKFTGPKPAFEHPIATDYGGVRPHLFEHPIATDYGGVMPHFVEEPVEPKMAYGMKAPIEPKFSAEHKGDENKE